MFHIVHKSMLFKTIEIINSKRKKADSQIGIILSVAGVIPGNRPTILFTKIKRNIPQSIGANFLPCGPTTVSKIPMLNSKIASKTPRTESLPAGAEAVAKEGSWILATTPTRISAKPTSAAVTT